MSEYDGNVPLTLKNTQQWFADIITRPIDDNSQMNPISPSGIPMTVEAPKFIVPSPTLSPDKRIQIYNQQYWWRLLTTLHDNFPLTTRIFGYYDFNNIIGVPYLEMVPPDHWSLNHLGDRLPEWVRANYNKKDKELVYQSIDTDWAYVKGFFGGEYLLDESHQTDLINKKLYLQPHITLRSSPLDIMPFYDKMLDEEPKYWEEHKFPHLKAERNYFFVIYRDKQYNITWSEIDEYQFTLLSKFEEGTSISDACNWLEQQDREIREAAMKNLHLWFQEWTVYGWLGSNDQ